MVFKTRLPLRGQILKQLIIHYLQLFVLCNILHYLIIRISIVNHLPQEQTRSTKPMWVFFTMLVFLFTMLVYNVGLHYHDYILTGEWYIFTNSSFIMYKGLIVYKKLAWISELRIFFTFRSKMRSAKNGAFFHGLPISDWDQTEDAHIEIKSSSSRSLSHLRISSQKIQVQTRLHHQF